MQWAATGADLRRGARGGATVRLKLAEANADTHHFPAGLPPCATPWASTQRQSPRICSGRRRAPTCAGVLAAVRPCDSSWQRPMLTPTTSPRASCPVPLPEPAPAAGPLGYAAGGDGRRPAPRCSRRCDRAALGLASGRRTSRRCFAHVMYPHHGYYLESLTAALCRGPRVSLWSKSHPTHFPVDLLRKMRGKESPSRLTLFTSPNKYVALNRDLLSFTLGTSCVAR